MFLLLSEHCVMVEIVDIHLAGWMWGCASAIHTPAIKSNLCIVAFKLYISQLPLFWVLPMKVDVKKERRSSDEWEKTTVHMISSYKLL